jgi:hypothetical protein
MEKGSRHFEYAHAFLLSSAAARTKFRKSHIAYGNLGTHMTAHCASAIWRPLFQRFAPALTGSQGRRTRLLARHSARIEWGGRSPHHPDALTHDRHHSSQHRCARVSRLSEKHNPVARNASGAAPPLPRASQKTPQRILAPGAPRKPRTAVPGLPCSAAPPPADVSPCDVGPN